jgi:hypothetical protein
MREDCHMLAALVNVVGASSGTGAALLPLRNGGFLVAFVTRSQIDGNSGDDEMTMRESWCAILAGEEESMPPAAMLGLSSRNTALRPARPILAQRILEDGSFGVRSGDGVSLSCGCRGK